MATTAPGRERWRGSGPPAAVAPMVLCLRDRVRLDRAVVEPPETWKALR